MKIDEIVENFEIMDDWEDRYRYLIELGRGLEPLRDNERTPQTKVHGCTSQVWLVTQPLGSGPHARLKLRGDSDAHIVRGLIAVLLAIHSGQRAHDILTTDERAVFAKLGLDQHLTQQRSNGLASMVARVKADAAVVADGGFAAVAEA